MSHLEKPNFKTLKSWGKIPGNHHNTKKNLAVFRAVVICNDTSKNASLTKEQELYIIKIGNVDHLTCHHFYSSKKILLTHFEFKDLTEFNFRSQILKFRFRLQMPRSFGRLYSHNFHNFSHFFHHYVPQHSHYFLQQYFFFIFGSFFVQ